MWILLLQGLMMILLCFKIFESDVSEKPFSGFKIVAGESSGSFGYVNILKPQNVLTQFDIE